MFSFNDFVNSYLYTFISTIIVLMILFFGNRFLKKINLKKENNLSYHIIMFILWVSGFITIILTLPISDSLRGQILSFFGILISATIAFSSTNFLGNIMAGIMMKMVSSYKIGDFVEIENKFGRVTEQGLFHVEIQTEDRNLSTFSNMYVVKNPIKVVPKSGTVITAQVSLGYDVPRQTVEKLLIDAAGSIKLENPFVYIIELGDFSILYRISGLLTEVGKLLSTRSALRGAILDFLHKKGIEIVSPNFMNTKVVTKKIFIPSDKFVYKTEVKNEPEKVVFDKAEKVTELEKTNSLLEEKNEEIKEFGEALNTKIDEKEKEKIEKEIIKSKKQSIKLEKEIVNISKTIEKIDGNEK
jgi:small conductance mechanosensitive channel